MPWLHSPSSDFHREGLEMTQRRVRGQVRIISITKQNFSDNEILFRNSRAAGEESKLTSEAADCRWEVPSSLSTSYSREV